ncbi:MAG: hypothetical protein R3F20_08975 [Planctomycetota bacterium]
MIHPEDGEDGEDSEDGEHGENVLSTPLRSSVRIVLDERSGTDRRPFDQVPAVRSGDPT